MLVPGSECLWWLGAISGRGRGRFRMVQDQVVITHGSPSRLHRGVDALEPAPLLGDRCGNPPCQRTGDRHVDVSITRKNRRERCVYWRASRR